MEHQEQEVYAVREHKQSRYEKRLILKIVKEVETGLPRKEANQIYGLGKATLDGWMRDYGSLDYHMRTSSEEVTPISKSVLLLPP